MSADASAFDGDVKGRTLVAMRQCQEQIDWFVRNTRRFWFFYRTFQLAVILLSGISPILIVFTQLPKPIQALPAALAALAAAVASSFHWHEDAVRWAVTRDQLKSELRQGILTGELAGWRASEESAAKKDDGQAAAPKS